MYTINYTTQFQCNLSQFSYIFSHFDDNFARLSIGKIHSRKGLKESREGSRDPGLWFKYGSREKTEGRSGQGKVVRQSQLGRDAASCGCISNTFSEFGEEYS